MKKLLLFTIILLMVTTAVFTQTTAIPDPNFEQALINLGYDIGVPDGSVPTANINTVTYLYLGYQNISDLTGIEDFVDLYSFYCNNNQLLTLDLSSNSVLYRLDCSYNQLSTLSLIGNSNLEILDCGNNQLLNLDVNANPLLINLNAPANSLNNINLINNISLTSLGLGNNQLTTLNLNNNISLEHLNIVNNQVSILNLIYNVSLTDIWISNNNIGALDISNSPNLSVIWGDNNQITTLDVSNNTLLTQLWCTHNLLTSLDVRNGNNSSMNVFSTTGNPNLTCISVDDDVYSTSNWTNIDPQHYFSANCSSNCTQTTSITDAAFENYLETHDANGNTSTWPNTMGDGILNNGEVCTANINSVTSLDIHSLGISSLTGIEGFIALTNLHCPYNSLTSIDVSSNTLLVYLGCFGNQLTSINVNNLLSLVGLSASDNMLTTIDVSTNTALEQLGVSGNLLANINISNNIFLTQLVCGWNQIGNIDVSNNIALMELACEFTEITSLDLSNNSAFSFLNAENNSLTSLDLRNGNNEYGVIQIVNNPNLCCINVDDDVWSTANWLSAWGMIDPQHYFSTNCTATGCTYPDAINFNTEATADDGSCIYEEYNLEEVYNSGYTDGIASVICPEISNCPTDLNGNGSVGTPDLLIFLGAFGTYCE
jgi:hypothetical protein